jgi:hypothetical protein
MSIKFIKSIIRGLLLAVALFISYPSQADHAHPNPSKKEIRLEARLLKQKGRTLQQQGKELLREGRTMKGESGNRKEARRMRKEGRHLLKIGKNMEQQGRMLKKGKISLYSIKNC